MPKSPISLKIHINTSEAEAAIRALAKLARNAAHDAHETATYLHSEVVALQAQNAGLLSAVHQTEERIQELSARAANILQTQSAAANDLAEKIPALIKTWSE